RGALSALLRGVPLSKSAISRIVGRLEALFTDWRKRSLKEEAVVLLYLDAIALRVKIANKVISAPCWWRWESKRTGRRWCWIWNCCRASPVSVGVGFWRGWWGVD